MGERERLECTEGWQEGGSQSERERKTVGGRERDVSWAGALEGQTALEGGRARGTETKTTGGEVSSRAKVGDAVLAADFEQELAVDLSVQRHVLDETCQMPSLC